MHGVPTDAMLFEGHNSVAVILPEAVVLGDSVISSSESILLNPAVRSAIVDDILASGVSTNVPSGL